MRTYLIALTLTISLFLSLSCADDQPDFITQEQMEEMARKNSDLIILDVRQPEERTGPLGKINGSVNVPLSRFAQGIARLDLDKDMPVVVLCRTQNRSRAAYDELRKMGFSNIYILKGGMMDYEHDNP
ncbi:MAG: rhodanese-like domain-containing protein [Desulfonatronovibrio sp.]